MTVFVISTMTTSVSYNVYGYVGEKGTKQGILPVVKKRVVINGGAGLPSTTSGFGDMAKDKQTGAPIWTAQGVVTPVTDEQYEILKDHWLFKKHLEGGQLKVVNHDVRQNHKAVMREVRNMEQKDEFAQLTPATVRERAKVDPKLKIKDLSNETELRL